jgi:hypothetical protein
MRFLFGSGFDTDPQYPWAVEILASEDDQMQRAEQLRAKTIEYQEKVSGPEAVNTRHALKYLATLVEQPAPQSTPDFDADMLARMARVFPQKTAYHKRPKVVRVQSTEKAEEIVGLAQQRGWEVIVGVEPDEIEDLSDLRKLMRAGAPPEVRPRLPPKISGTITALAAAAKSSRSVAAP